ncbi:hypothetical protein T440DRAFT_319708 [Plenodomus tracheiphilus IPT5]|uniref:Uncharacterized protein n=1 Tax=Plenodomus tracheiphilus IPT5 TaxID=1408161 RepID=A0A6A7BCR5_9PLEO|nr:hypothetical protein T440DRAFT_319708 [Plenodomus tracheiphilus IPT5]
MPQYPKNGANQQINPIQVDWHADPYWRSRRLSPAQLQVHDIRLESWKNDNGSILEMREVLASSLLPALHERDALLQNLDLEGATKHRNDQVRLEALAAEFGWLNTLRSKKVQETVQDSKEARKCRWIHISSKFSDYLSGCLFGLSDWGLEPQKTVAALQQLEHCVNQQERFSKHGRYFAPFFQYLHEGVSDDDDVERPMLLSVPFLDWTIEGEQPPLRFQVDPREGYQSSRSHLIYYGRSYSTFTA